jgi:hypothetical protein
VRGALRSSAAESNARADAAKIILADAAHFRMLDFAASIALIDSPKSQGS